MTRFNSEINSCNMLLCAVFYVGYSNRQAGCRNGHDSFQLSVGAFKIVKYNISFSALLKGGFFIIIE